MAKSVEESMNSMMLSRDGVLEIPEVADTYLNAKMLGDPIFGKGYISIPIDGSF